MFQIKYRSEIQFLWCFIWHFVNPIETETEPEPKMGLFTYDEVKLRERAVHRHQNDHVHSNIHPAIKQYVQFTFAQNMNEFMNNHSTRSGTTLSLTSIASLLGVSRHTVHRRVTEE